MGRPSDYTPEIGDRICAQLAEGRSLRTICYADDMPSAVTVYAWLRKHEEFLNNYVRAREDQADTQFDELVDIADNSTPETAQVDKLRIETRKWAASKLKPKKYGEKTETTLLGPDGGPVKFEKIERVIVDPANRNAPSV